MEKNTKRIRKNLEAILSSPLKVNFLESAKVWLEENAELASTIMTFEETYGTKENFKTMELEIAEELFDDTLDEIAEALAERGLVSGNLNIRAGWARFDTDFEITFMTKNEIFILTVFHKKDMYIGKPFLSFEIAKDTANTDAE